MRKGPAYVNEKVVFLKEKVGSIKSEFDRMKPYSGKQFQNYDSISKSLSEDILILNGIVQYDLAYKIKMVDSILEKIPSYMSDLGHLQLQYSKKR